MQFIFECLNRSGVYIINIFYFQEDYKDMSPSSKERCQHCDEPYGSSKLATCEFCKTMVHAECNDKCRKKPPVSSAVHGKNFTTLKGRQVIDEFNSDSLLSYLVTEEKDCQVHWGKKGLSELKEEKIGQDQKSTRDRAKKVAKDKGAVIAREVANKGNEFVWKKVGAHASADAATFSHHAHDSATATEFIGIKVAHAEAGAGVAKATASASANPLQAKAGAGAYGPNAGAKAALVEGIVEANAEAYVGKAAAEAGVGIEHLGAYAAAEAVTVRAGAGIAHTPLQAHAQGPAAGAETGVSWDYAGGNVSASLGEARAGPFAVRAGVKFGAGIRNGVPELDVGPISVPCSVM